jgi:hypothetical protein
MPVILVVQELEIGGLWFEARPDRQFTRPYLEKTLHEKASRVAQGEDPEFKSQYCKYIYI